MFDQQQSRLITIQGVSLATYYACILLNQTGLNKSLKVIGSMAGPVIKATERKEFKNGLRKETKLMFGPSSSLQQNSPHGSQKNPP